MLIVGEIGISPSECMSLRWWQVSSIIRGYNRRHRHLWSVARWHAFNIMSAIPYCDLKKNGILSPKDLISFPWDSMNEGPTDDEVAEMTAEIDALNAIARSEANKQNNDNNQNSETE